MYFESKEEREDFHQDLALKKLLGRKATKKQFYYDYVRQKLGVNGWKETLPLYYEIFSYGQETLDPKAFTYEVDFDFCLKFKQLIKALSDEELILFIHLGMERSMNTFGRSHEYRTGLRKSLQKKAREYL